MLEHVNENRMRSQNIAIVFGPTLMWPEKESSAIAVNMMCQNSIVEYILSGFDKLFYMSYSSLLISGNTIYRTSLFYIESYQLQPYAGTCSHVSYTGVTYI